MVNQVHNLKLFLRKRIACCIQDTHTPSTHYGQACAQVKHLELRRRHPETAGEKFWIKKTSQNCRRNIMSLKKLHTAGETSWWRNLQTAGQINSVGQYPRAISYVPFRNIHSGPNEDAEPAGQFRLQNCTRTRLVLEFRCGRIEYLFQTTKTQDKIKVHRKLCLSLPRIGILGVPNPNCMLRLQFWDGVLLSPAALRWHLLTCNMKNRQMCDGTFSPAIFFTCRFGMTSSRAAKCTEKSKWSS